MKEGTTHRPTSHLVHLYAVPFLWPREKHRRQSSWFDFAAQCLLWLLLLRLAVVVPLCLLLPQNSLLTLPAFSPDSESCQQSEFHWWLPRQVLFIFFQPLLESSALFRLLCLTWHSFRNIIPVRYECLLQWQQNRSKATMWVLYKIPAIWACPRRY